MFEEVSKEYARNNTSYYGTDDCYDTDTEKVEQVFKDGAEFGYSKANEWHYVKDGDLPPLRKEVLWCVDEQLWFGELLENQIDFGEWKLDRILFNDYEIAWKEIVLPELKDGK